MNNLERTIAAISTPPGKGGVALIRISGDDAISIAAKVFFPASHKSLSGISSSSAVYGFIRDTEGRIVDDGIATIFRAPASFTGEDTVEISCHGGVLVSHAVLETLIIAGASPAEAGEFTRRAFLSGKLSLTEAEAIGDLLEAKNMEQVALAGVESRSRLTEMISDIHTKLITLLSTMYAKIDFPDEDLADMSDYEVALKVYDILEKTNKLIKSYKTGHAINEGIRAAICGAPNVGKSSIYNLITEGDHAIVTDIAGTTRDVLEREVTLGRVLLRLIDTAGIRSTSDPVEKIGIERSEKELSSCELLLAVFDGSRELQAEDEEIIRLARRSNAVKVAIINKTDLEQVCDAERIKACFENVHNLSANDESSREIISDIVDKLFTDGEISPANDAIVASARQHASLVTAAQHLEEAHKQIINGLPFDIASSSIEAAAGVIAMIDGRGVNEEMVNAIFSKFCVGK